MLALSVFVITPYSYLSAYSSGSGTETNPYIITGGDHTMDSGWYKAGSDVIFGSGSTVIIGYSNKGVHYIIDGGHTVSDGIVYIGGRATSSATVQVSGSGSTWINASGVTVGVYGSGVSNVLDGGLVENSSTSLACYSSGTGTLTVSGEKSVWADYSYTYVGEAGTGTLNLLAGGSLKTPICYVAYEFGSRGTITVSGANSSLDVSTPMPSLLDGSIIIGRRGTGQMTISNHGYVTETDSIILALTTGSTGALTVTGQGSLLELNSELTVGSYGTGTLLVEKGGSIANGPSRGLISVGGSYGGTGSMTVKDDGTLVDVDDIYVTSGTLSLINGSDTQTRYIIFNRGSAAIDGAGTTVTCSGFIGVDPGFLLNITNRAFVNINGFFVGGSTTLTGSGTECLNSSYLEIGSYNQTGATLTVSDGALVTASTNSIMEPISIETGSFLRLSDGFVAMQGNRVAFFSKLVAGGGIQIFNGTEWVVASACDVGVTYYETPEEAAAATGYSELAGYTVLTGGVQFSHVGWAAGQAYSSYPNWFKSGWYGSFYSPQAWGHWIWHQTHGWQFIYGLGGDDVAVYDYAAQQWFYTDSEFYPALFSYSSKTWYYYLRGISPNRVFWDYATGTVVEEKSINH